MTRPRYDSHSTEIGLWLREQDALDSKRSKFVATNLDYIWENYGSGLWMLIEEKRYGATLTWSQARQFERLDGLCSMIDQQYRGFHVVMFGCTSPEDGAIWVDGEQAEPEYLVQFLRFELPAECYWSYFRKVKAAGFQLSAVRQWIISLAAEILYGR